MASITFVLKEPKAENTTTVMAVFRHDKKRIKRSTGIQIEPEKWNPAKERIKSLDPRNKILAKYESFLADYLRDSRENDQTISIEGISKFIDQALGKIEVKAKEKNLLKFIQSFIVEVDKRPETIKGYRNSLNRLTEFAKDEKRKLDFEEIDLSLLNDLVRYFQTKSNKGKGFAKNTIHLHVKNLKVFMKESKERGLHNNSAHESKRFSVGTESTPKVYLTKEEIQQIRELDLSKNKKLERVRDLFLLHINTGVRYSDLKKINRKNLQEYEGAHFFEIRQEKTAQFLWIPVLNPEVLSILEKYDGHSVGINPNSKFLSNQKYNKYLKELGQAAQILEPFTTYITIGGERQESTQAKAELICSHTARRTFATNAYKAGLPTASIMSITGHRTETAFRKYIQLSSKEHALELFKRSKEDPKEFTPLRITS
jgi:integrase